MGRLNIRILFFIAAIFGLASFLYGGASVHAETHKKSLHKKTDHSTNRKMKSLNSGGQNEDFDPDYGKNPAGRYDGGSEPDPI